MKIRLITSAIVLIAMVACKETPKKEVENSNNGVYFANLKDGDKVKSPFVVEMGVRGMIVEPAGKLEDAKGHHHLIIDGSFVEKGQMVAKDETHLHFGKGQTSDTLTLSPGSHTLTLQFADGMHQSYGQDWSKTIVISVEK